jgi:non-ribosomal peptide synthetase-like protein
MKPGRYPLWGSYFFRWWLVQRLVLLTHPKWFQGSPVMRLFLRALGTRVGRGAIIGEIEVGSYDLLTIGENASIGGKTVFNNVRIEGATFVVGETVVGPDS